MTNPQGLEQAAGMIQVNLGDEGGRLLEPVDRISEILFGLIMAVTIVGSLSIATAGTNEMRAVSAAALGCNIAWGMVDAIMYLVRTAAGRGRNRALAKRIVDSDTETAHRLIAHVLPAHVRSLVGPTEIEAMRQRLLTLSFTDRPILSGRDWLEAGGVFVLVVVATLPVVAPFFLVSEALPALRWSQAIAVVMLFTAGIALGRYAGHRSPLRTGLAMAAIGGLVIAAVKALGG
jgi:VIT1/CCC1 family predicted Fe2+/Mn2+ transporter